MTCYSPPGTLPDPLQYQHWSLNSERVNSGIITADNGQYDHLWDKLFTIFSLKSMFDRNPKNVLPILKAIFTHNFQSNLSWIESIPGKKH